MNVVLFMDNENKRYSSLKKFQDIMEGKIDTLHVVHFMRQAEYAYQGDMIVPFYPNEAQLFGIKKKLKTELETVAREFKDWGAKKVEFHILEDHSAKRGAVKFINSNADLALAVCLTPKKDGVGQFFHSSFTHYLSDHARVDVLAIRD